MAWRDIDPEFFDLTKGSPESRVRIECSDEEYARLEAGESITALLDLNGVLLLAVLQRPWSQTAIPGT